MKKLIILFSFLLVLFTNSIVASTIEIYIFKDPDPPGPRPLSLTLIPVSASVDETDLAIYFDWSVGFATITVYNASNQIVDQVVVNTNVNSEVFMPIDLWDNGAYTMKITYGTTTLRGNFNIL